MRQLRATGWMHNRVRMIVASFLVKDLHLEWQHGARHFMRWLVDGDLASNQHGWQWTAGCGTDAAPYFRVFNPTSAGREVRPRRRLRPALGAGAGRRAAKHVHEPPRPEVRRATRRRSWTTPRSGARRWRAREDQGMTEHSDHRLTIRPLPRAGGLRQRRLDAGAVAALVPGSGRGPVPVWPAIEVTLRQPPPLDVAMTSSTRCRGAGEPGASGAP